MYHGLHPITSEVFYHDIKVQHIIDHFIHLRSNKIYQVFKGVVKFLISYKIDYFLVSKHIFLSQNMTFLYFIPDLKYENT